MKFKHFGKVLFLIFAASVLIEDASWSQSRKTRPAGIGSLLEMKCYGRGLSVKNREGIVINRRTYTAVGTFGFDNDIVHKTDPIEVSCDLASRNQSPIYKSLTMTVGANDQDGGYENNYSARLRITTYTDGDVVGSTEIGFRELKRFSLNVSGVRSVAFTVECLQSNKWYCPGLRILEDKLVK